MAKATAVWQGNRQLRRMLVPIDSLAAHPMNPRQHDLPAIRESLERYGQQRPILIVPPGRVTTSATIIAGHGTTAAAEELEWTHIAALTSELTDDEIERFVLADNRTSDRAGYHDETLAKLLTQVNEQRSGLAGTGYTRDDLDALLADLRKSVRTGGHGPDYVPPPPAEPKSRRGELYDLGEHLLMCGDCTSDEDLKTLIGGTKVQAIITDPPYGIALDTKFSGMHKANEYGPGGNDYAPVIGDDVPYDPTELMERFAKVKEQFWWGADYYREYLPPGGSWVVWDKRENAQGMDLDSVIGSAFELCWSRQAHKRELARVTWAGHHGLQGEDTRTRVHPTQKPVALVGWLIERYVKRRAGPVLDLYAGSGSTLIACEIESVPCLAMEIDPAYCDVIRQRYADIIGAPELAP